MDIILDPNIAYIFVVTGVMMTLMAIVNPGTGFFEVGALFSLSLAGYAIYTLSVNYWALVILIASIVPFIYAIRSKGKPQRKMFLGATIISIVIGSVFMFRTEEQIAAINPFLAVFISVLTGGLLWAMIIKTLEAHHVKPSHSLKSLIGQAGETKTDVHHDGTVQVAGELWSARSTKKIPAGNSIRVIGREGFTLLVEKLNS